MSQRYVSLYDMSRRLGKHQSTLFNWVSRRLIPPGQIVQSRRVWTESEAEQIVSLTRRVRLFLANASAVRVSENRVRCQFCGLEGLPPGVTRHMRTCTALWDFVASGKAQGSEPQDLGRAEESMLTSRKALLAEAERVIDGGGDVNAFVRAVRTRLDRIRELEEELRRLRGGEQD